MNLKHNLIKNNEKDLVWFPGKWINRYKNLIEYLDQVHTIQKKNKNYNRPHIKLVHKPEIVSQKKELKHQGLGHMRLIMNMLGQKVLKLE